MAFQSSICDDEARRALVLDPVNPLNGIDFLEVSADQTTLRVYFLKDLPLDGYGLPAAPHNITVVGGARIRNIKVTEVRRADDNLLEVDVVQPGDFTNYTLVINSASLDPFYAQVEFNFKASCPNRFDCKPRHECPPDPVAEPLIDYMAKDYASFRQALLDLISAKVPGWTERHEADLGMTLLELLAYAGDHLSYYQDSVANESYLETARQRISVRRHARLVDYRIHDGASARTFVHFRVNNALAQSVAAGTPVLARIDKRLGALIPPHPTRLPVTVSGESLDATPATFETMAAVNVRSDLNEIRIHTWGNSQCCLPRGVTGIDLLGDLTGILEPGDFLLIEEVLGPITGLAQDADLSHRQVVRLQKVDLSNDPVLGNTLTRVAWDEADALRFAVCVSTRLENGTLLNDVSVARGNLTLADHGRRHTDEHPEPESNPGAQGIEVGSRAYRFQLERGPISFRIGFDASDTTTPVLNLLLTDPSDARPAMVDMRLAIGPILETDWTATSDLLANDPFAHVFSVETDNVGFATIRFGDNVYGQSPSDGAFITATYRVGVGVGGNIGADSLAHLIDDGTLSFIDSVRNPIPAWGGTEPEALERVKQIAPAAFRAEQFRAVTEADYAAAAQKHPLVSKAIARFLWTGSWYTVFLTIDLKNRTEMTRAIEKSILDWVTRYTLAGYDLEIDPPVYVALDLEIEVCVKSDHFRGDVEQAVLRALSSGTFVDGTVGFFHPDKFTFGQPLYLSRLYAAVEAIQGVDSVLVTRFRRIDEHDPDPARPATQANLNRGYIKIARLEILREDNNPSFPEDGTLRLVMRGGK
ncbi:MAG TPA: putative baseplate assembly protein [Blastocatellia bacterium]|nr:putative baseplate assembly protein [Blastocatellia bacterium]